MKNTVFYLGIGALFTHELDAVQNHEWRILPLIRMLPEETAMNLFIAAHVPLFALLLACVTSSDTRTRHMSRLIIGAFLIFHGGLHTLYMSHPSYEFSSILSNTLIFGGAVLGAVYVTIELFSKKTGST